ncbi:uncharacterized protein BKA78DRAFT_300793 [Phyllosticta capitalensis]|uniref:uncharacterized protein n=1 Tax=Phyllosticta capitalensis TaxID=121624 RepID=UPI0031316767
MATGLLHWLQSEGVPAWPETLHALPCVSSCQLEHFGQNVQVGLSKYALRDLWISEWAQRRRPIVLLVLPSARNISLTELDFWALHSVAHTSTCAPRLRTAKVAILVSCGRLSIDQINIPGDPFIPHARIAQKLQAMGLDVTTKAVGLHITLSVKNAATTDLVSSSKHIPCELITPPERKQACEPCKDAEKRSSMITAPRAQCFAGPHPDAIPRRATYTPPPGKKYTKTTLIRRSIATRRGSPAQHGKPEDEVQQLWRSLSVSPQQPLSPYFGLTQVPTDYYKESVRGNGAAPCPYWHWRNSDFRVTGPPPLEQMASRPAGRLAVVHHTLVKRGANDTIEPHPDFLVRWDDNISDHFKKGRRPRLGHGRGSDIPSLRPCARVSFPNRDDIPGDHFKSLRKVKHQRRQERRDRLQDKEGDGFQPITNTNSKGEQASKPRQFVHPTWCLGSASHH